MLTAAAGMGLVSREWDHHLEVEAAPVEGAPETSPQAALDGLLKEA